MNDIKNNQTEYDPAVIKAVRSLITQDANFQREFNYLAL